MFISKSQHLESGVACKSKFLIKKMSNGYREKPGNENHVIKQQKENRMSLKCKILNIVHFLTYHICCPPSFPRIQTIKERKL